MKSKKKTCKNCDKLFKESFEYCPYCGQQTNDELTVKVLFYNTISNYFSFDARFFKSFFPLLFRPGYLASKFIEGKRLLFLHPAQMYLFIAVVFFFLFSFVQRDQVRTLDAELAKTLKKESSVEINLDEQSLDSIDLEKFHHKQEKDSLENLKLKGFLEENNIVADLSQKEIDSLLKSENIKSQDFLNFDSKFKDIDSLIKADAPEEVIYKSMGMSDDANFFEKRIFTQGLKFYKSRKGGSMLQAFYDAIPIAMFFLLPIFALILKLLFFKRGLYAHHLVFSFYYFSFLFTVFSIILGVNFIWDISDTIDWLVVFSTFFYLLVAIKHFYKQGWFKSFIKTTITSFLFLLLVAPLTAILLGVFAFMFY